MLTQKGVIFIPFVVWSIAVGVVITALGAVVIRNGTTSEEITHDGSRTGPRVEYKEYCTNQPVFIYENEKIPFATESGTILWTKGDIDCYKAKRLAEKSATAPLGTPGYNHNPNTTPKPTTTNNQINSKSQAQVTGQVTGDGTRTGRIVKYKEYCKGGQEISVYESELITRKASDGNTYSMTKDDWDCSDKNNSTQPPSNTQATGTYVPSTTSTYTAPSYPPCVVYYPVLEYSQTYLNISPEQCQQWKNQANIATQTYTPAPTNTPTPIPQPTTNPSLCAQAVAMWNEYKEDFHANKYNNYSSSFEAVQALESERLIIQNQINSYGCSNRLSL